MFRPPPNICANCKQNTNNGTANNGTGTQSNLWDGIPPTDYHLCFVFNHNPFPPLLNIPQKPWFSADLHIFGTIELGYWTSGGWNYPLHSHYGWKSPSIPLNKKSSTPNIPHISINPYYHLWLDNIGWNITGGICEICTSWNMTMTSMTPTMWSPTSLAKLVYNSNNYGLSYL